MALHWTMQQKLTEISLNDKNEAIRVAASVLSVEFTRLAKQKCGYCDGFGHSGNDCPTDRKISHLRGGVAEQNKIVQQVRKASRIAANMKDVQGFSLLSAETGKAISKKRKRSEMD